jgi:hypothetical protein
VTKDWQKNLAKILKRVAKTVAKPKKAKISSSNLN